MEEDILFYNVDTLNGRKLLSCRFNGLMSLIDRYIYLEDMFYGPHCCVHYSHKNNAFYVYDNYLPQEPIKKNQIISFAINYCKLHKIKFKIRKEFHNHVYC